MKLKRDFLDAIFSDFVRMRDRWTCQRCATYYAPNKRRGLHNSHLVISRRGKSTRWLPENCAAMCRGCHGFFGENPEKARRWYIERYSREQYDLVRFMARQIMKSWELKDYKLAKAEFLKAEMARLEGLGYEPPARKKP